MHTVVLKDLYKIWYHLMKEIQNLCPCTSLDFLPKKAPSRRHQRVATIAQIVSTSFEKLCQSQQISAFYGIIQAIELITKCMTAWRRNRDQGRDRLAYAYDNQRSIGWGCFLEGSLAKEWLLVHYAHHLQSLGSQQTASVWARGLIRQLWLVAFRMWQHRNGWQHSEDNPRKWLL
jgi:hypothetical protein